MKEVRPLTLCLKINYLEIQEDKANSLVPCSFSTVGERLSDQDLKTAISQIQTEKLISLSVPNPQK